LKQTGAELEGFLMAEITQPHTKKLSTCQTLHLEKTMTDSKEGSLNVGESG
jgi:hypothetical protein